MKKFTFLFLVIITTVSYSQEDLQASNLEYKSFSFTAIPFSIYIDDGSGGLAFNADLSFVYKKHIITTSAGVGSEYTVLGSGESFEQVNLLYGRELMLNKTIFIDTHLGFGYFSFKPASRNLKRKTSIGFPLLLKLRFKTGKRFSIGLQFQANINSVNNIYTTGVVLQWNKR